LPGIPRRHRQSVGQGFGMRQADNGAGILQLADERTQQLRRRRQCLLRELGAMPGRA